MKLICPKCKSGVKIGGQSRFLEFTCQNCNYNFMGLEAQISLWSLLSAEFTMTGCPYCWTPLEIRSAGINRGYIGPKACYSCGRKLPKRPNRQPGTEWETNFEKMEKSLRSYACSAAVGADLIRQLEEVESEFSPTEFAQLKQMVSEAVKRGTA